MRYTFFRIVLMFCFAFVALNALGQYEVVQRFKSLSLEQGLSSKNVNDFYQDSLGFIWVCTAKGIDRYDGIKFQKFDFGLPDSLQLIDYKCFFIDKEGNKYIGTENQGFYVIRPDGTYSSFTETSTGDDFYFILPIIQDGRGRIWFSTFGQGLHQYIPDSDTVISYRHNPEDPSSISSDQLYNIVEDDNGSLWIGTESHGVNLFNPDEGTFRNFKADDKNERSLLGNSIYQVEKDGLGRIWLTSYRKGLSMYNPITNDFENYPFDAQSDNSLSTPLVYELEKNGDKGLYIATQDKGIDYLDFKTMQFSNISHDANDVYTLSGDHINGLFVDNEGILWVAPMGQAINTHHESTDVFQALNYHPFDINSLSSNEIKSIKEDKEGNIWISHNKNGVDRIDAVTNEVTHYNSDAVLGYRLSSDNINHLEIDEYDNKWIATKFGGVNKIDGRTGKVSSFGKVSEGKDGLLHDWVFASFADSKGNIWFGTAIALSKYDPITNTFQHFQKGEDGDDESPHGQYVHSIYEDSQGMIWFVTENGLEKYDINSGQFVPKDLAKSSFYKNGDQLWYIGNSVIKSYDFITDQTSEYQLRDGIIANDIIIDDDGLFWLSCNDGIWSLDTNNDHYHHYNAEDGLISSQFVNGSYVSPSTGRLYFNSEKGVCTFHPEDVIIDTTAPNVVITSLGYIDSKDSDNSFIDVPNVTALTEITFPYYYNILSFEFAALSYTKSSKNRYQYMLEGLNNSWIDLGTVRSITLTNLDPKTYTLRVKGSNGDGTWNEESTSLQITITPPWWQTWWAYVIYLSLIVFSIWWWIQLRDREQRRKLVEERVIVERLKEVDKLKDQFLANTSHELRTPLNGIIGLSESLRDGVAGQLSQQAISNLDMIIGSGRRLANLVNDILDFSKLKNHDLDLSLMDVDMKSACDVVIALSTPLIKSKDIKIYNNIPEDIPLVSADENRVQQILHNLIGNAIKFTDEGDITISAEYSVDEVITTITDTGIGIPEEKFESIFQSFDQVDGDVARKYGGTGLGLTVTRQLVNQHGGKIDLKSKVGEGTAISFSLPKSGSERSAASLMNDQSSFINSLEVSTIVQESAEISIENVEDIAILENANEIKILVADDEPVNRQVLQNHLQIAGYQVDIVIDGPAAIQKLDEKKYDLILLDVMMPRMSGFEVADHIRKKHLPTELPIIMLTAKNRVADLVEGFSIGANDYLTKPFMKRELLSRIKTHLNLKRVYSASRQFVPDAFIKSVGRDDIIDVEIGDYAEKKVTVLFTDIREYTHLSENMTPKDNFEFVKSYVGRMGPIIQSNQGFVNQYLGDGIMCIFDKSPQNALDATIQMQHEIKAYNERRLKKGNVPIKVGMGFCTGPLIMGIIGDESRKEPTSISTTVNLASRVEGLTKYYGANILLDEKSLDEINNIDDYNIRSLGKVIVKGQENEIELFECFDGDEQGVKDKKAKLISHFKEAHDHFINARFEKALVTYNAIIDENPEDRVCLYFSLKCKEYIEYGPPENWDGVDRLNIK